MAPLNMGVLLTQLPFFAIAIEDRHPLKGTGAKGIKKIRRERSKRHDPVITLDVLSEMQAGTVKTHS
jgi:hypothetical protein